MDYRKLTSPCGIDCFHCEIYKENITDEVRQRIAGYVKEDLSTFQCEGCRVSGCVFIPGECQTKKCVEAKGVEFCHECDSFPCNKLHPCSDRAEKLPHNYKVFNLCRMKAIGFEAWVDEAKKIRETYFKGKIVIGSGPSLPKEET